jgi:hypothetical protein
MVEEEGEGEAAGTGKKHGGATATHRAEEGSGFGQELLAPADFIPRRSGDATDAAPLGQWGGSAG